MPLNEQQKWAAIQLAEGRTINDVAAECGVDRRTIYNWRQDEEFKQVFAEAKGKDVDAILLEEVESKRNPQAIKLWYERHGLLKTIKEDGDQLKMSDEDRNKILKLAYDTYCNERRVSPVSDGPDVEGLQDLPTVG